MSDAEQLNPAWWPRFWRSPAMLALCALLVVAFAWTFHWMGIRWDETNSYYSHGWLIPPIVAALLYRKRRQLAAARVRPCAWGLAILLPSLFVQVLSTAWQVGFVSGFSFIGALVGLTLTLFGAEVLRLAAFPLAFLVFMVPLPVLLVEMVSFRLKLLAARAAMGVLDTVGLPAVRNGSIIRIPTGTLVVDDVCSGLKYLISLTAFGALYAHISSVGKAQKVALFLISVPVSFVANVIRVILMVLVGYTLGVATAEKWYFHGTLGFMLFAVAFVMLFLTEALFQRLGRSRPAKASPRTAESLIAGRPTRRRSRWALSGAFRTVLIALVVCAALSTYLAWPRSTTPASDVLARVPLMMGSWQGADVPLDQHTYDVLGTRDVLSRIYQDGDDRESRMDFIVVMAKQTSKRTHPPEQCYSGGGYQIRNQTVRSVSLSTPEGTMPLAVRELVVQYNDEMHVVWYFYKSGDDLTTSYWGHQIGLALSRLARPGAADILIRLDLRAPGGDLEAARRLLNGFLSTALPVCLQRLP